MVIEKIRDEMNEEITLEECWKEGLLKTIKENTWLVTKSLQTAEKKLRDAVKSLDAGIYDGAVFFAYMSMFHAAKAVLFRDGVRERSHKCVVVYLKEKYGKAGIIPINLIHSLDSHRMERHEIVYGFEFIATREDAEVAVEDGKEFLNLVEKLLKG